MINTLSQEAAMALRQATDEAIIRLEVKVRRPLTTEEDIKAYFLTQRREWLTAIAQLRSLRAEIHQCVFDAYQREKG